MIQDDITSVSRGNAGAIYEKKRRKHSRKKRIIKGILAFLLILILGATVALALLYFSIDNRLSEGGQIHKDLSGVLSEKDAPGDPYYVLLLGKDAAIDETIHRSDTILLVRVDPGNKHITIISIPRDTKVRMENYGIQKINAAYAYGGRSGAVEAVSDFAGVPINHFAEVDFDGFKEMVDALNGVEVDVPVPINDRKAGPAKLEPGLQELNGEEALTFVRSRKFPDGDYSRMRHQRIFLKALADDLLNKSSIAEMTAAVDVIFDIVTTDMNPAEVITAMTTFRGMDIDKDIQTVVVPSEPVLIDGISYLEVDFDAWEKLMTKIDNGENIDVEALAFAEGLTVDEYISKYGYPSDMEPSPGPEERKSGLLKKPQVEQKSKSEITVDVMNGTNIDGAAGRVSTELLNAEYEIGQVGNAQEPQKTTMVLYSTDEDEDVAQSIARKLNINRVEKSTGDVHFDGDVLVLIGSDSDY